MLKRGDPSPWGVVEFSDSKADGLAFVSTSSHGGFVVSAERSRLMPEALRKVRTFVERGALDRTVGRLPWASGTRFYEEDCDYSLVVLAFPELFDRAVIRGAIGAALHWYGETVGPWLDSLPVSHPVAVARA